MPGRTPYDAVEAFLEPIQDALSCIARAKISLSPGGRHTTSHIHALALNESNPVRLRRGASSAVLLKLGMRYEVVRTEQMQERGAWRVSTRAYMYELQTESGELVWSYHWHPDSTVTVPHVHIGHTQLAEDAVLLYKAHHPTGRISLESVIRICIAEYGVTPRRDDWEKILEIGEADFENYRTWP